MVMRVISDEINTNGREGHECVPKQYRLNKKKISHKNIFLSGTNRLRWKMRTKSILDCKN